MRNKAFALIGVAALVIATPAQAGQDTPFDMGGAPIPFTNTGRGVQGYLNNQNWGTTKKVVFSGIGDSRNCITFTHNVPEYWRIICLDGYVNINDPLGSRICEVKVEITKPNGVNSLKTSYETGRCSTR